MTGAVGMWNVWYALAICGGIAAIALVVGICVYAIFALQSGRSVLPWSVRHRVEKARAVAEVAEMRAREEKAELLHLAMQPQRQRILEAIAQGSDETPAALLEGPTATDDGERLRQPLWDAMPGASA